MFPASALRFSIAECGGITLVKYSIILSKTPPPTLVYCKKQLFQKFRKIPFPVTHMNKYDFISAREKFKLNCMTANTRKVPKTDLRYIK